MRALPIKPVLGSVLALLCLTVLLLSAGAAPAHAAPAADTIIYLVRPGDRLADIAARYGVTIANIAQANGITDINLIWIGQKLIIPLPAPAASPTPPATPAASATPKPGANPTVTPTPAPTASPTPTPTTSGPTIHVVQAGETLSGIAQFYDTTVAALVEANGLGNADLIRVGMRLLIVKGSGGATVYSGQASRFEVSISQQRCWLYRDETVIARWACSTGRLGWGTRTGTFYIQSKEARAYGSTWNIWMPYWLGIYWAGGSENGIHGLPWNAQTGVQVWTGYVGTPITYGCVMLDNIHAKILYDMSYIGMPVIIRW